jgi:hypothetical protein
MMPDRSPVQLDARHCAAIRDEVGSRLRQYLGREVAPAPARIGKLLRLLHERDTDQPSIARSAGRNNEGGDSHH